MLDKMIGNAIAEDELDKVAGGINMEGTDGDLRRMLERGADVYSETVDAVMTKAPKWIDEREMAVNALQQMSHHRITGMPVLNEDKRVVGSILMQDIYKAGIVR